MNLDLTPVNYLDQSGDKAECTRIRTYLGSFKYTADEIDHPIRELSGGQKAKILLLKMRLSGAVISVSHDRKYIEEICDKEYELSARIIEIK